MIVIVLMMATGTTDPVREATVETWDTVLPGLTLPGSNPDGDGSAATGTYCEKQTEGANCAGATGYYAESEAAPFAATATKCSFSEPRTAMQALNNCSLLGDPAPGYFNTGVDAGCATYQAKCTACALDCMEAQISDVKENLEPASVFVLGLMVYLIVVIVWNNIMMSDDDYEGVSKMVGLVLNGVLLFLSLVMIVMGGLGAAKAADACPGAADCVPASVTMLVLLGVATMVVSGLIVFGVNSGNGMLVTVGTLILIFLAILMVLFALILGMSTGVVMDDMTYYYDTQYPKLRSALEKADNSYCQMTKVQCLAMATAGPSIAPATTEQSVQSGDPLVAITCEAGDPICITTMSYESVWKAMHAAASLEANKDSAPSWIANCKTTAMCIYCGDLYDRVPVASLGVHDASSGANAGRPCGGTCQNGACPYAVGSTEHYLCDAVTCTGVLVTDPPTGGCVARAEAFDWADAIVGTNNASVVGTPNVWNSAPMQTGVGVNQWQDHKLPGGTSASGSGSIPCMGESIDYGVAFYNNPADVMHNGDCIAPVSSDAGNVNFNKRCSGQTTGASTAGTVTALTSPTSPDCSGAAVLDITTAEVWTGMVENITRFDIPAKEAMPYCEEAIIDYAQQESNCKDFANQAEIEKDSFYSNCEQCSDPFAPFTFNIAGPEIGYRQCLNFFVGHMGQCSGSDTACQAVFTGNAVNSQWMVDKAFGDEKSGFCGYSDAGCKAKIKFDIESSMSTIGVMGAIFLGFFLGTIYCTYEAIISYKGGDDDDDDDE
jgi:hypothetical protein